MSGYFLSVDAHADLVDVYLASLEGWGKVRADKYLTDLYQLFDLLGDNPGLGTPRPELGYDLQCFPQGSHMVFFMEWEEKTAIVRVLHGSRDFEKLFDRYDPFPNIERAVGNDE